MTLERQGSSDPVLRDVSSRYLDDVEVMPRNALLSLQWQRLSAMLPYVYENGALIRSVWESAGVEPNDFDSLGDYFARAPFIDKDSLRQFRDEHDDPFAGLLCKPKDTVSFIGSSSGTTGDPTLFSSRVDLSASPKWSVPGLSEEGPGPYFGSTPRDLWEMGMRPGDQIVLFAIRFRGPIFRLFQSYGLKPILLGYSPEDFAQFLYISRQLRPQMCFVMSTPLMGGLQQVAKQTGIDMRDVFASYKAVIFAGEPLTSHHRKIFDQWGILDRVYNQTAFGDLGHAHECRERAGNHAWEDYGIAEFIDPDTSASMMSETGRGELVVTSLINGVDPLIRFRSGDLVDFDRSPCGCGRTHVRFTTVGRAGDILIIKGRSILPLDVWPLVGEFDECAAALFQIVRSAKVMDELKLRVGYDGTPNLSELQVKIETYVQEHLKVPVTVELVPQSELLKLGPPHKIPRTTAL